MAYGSFIVGGGGTIPRIGDVVVTTVKTSPATRYKNTVWELVAQNRVPMGAGDGHEGGETVEAGLPNITGLVDNALFVYASTASNNAFFTFNSMSNKTYKEGTSTEYFLRYLSLDASRSSPIYGNSTTVQPPAYYFYLWRRVS